MALELRKAKQGDLEAIVALLMDDELGKTRESMNECDWDAYLKAFKQIDQDTHQALMVLERDGELLGTCHLTLMPSLTFKGAMRLQIESVRVCRRLRGQNLGQKMLELAIHWGKEQGATIIQLTTHKERPDALRFYKKLGFKATHVGMKLYLD